MKNKIRDFNYIQFFGPELKFLIERQIQKSKNILVINISII